MIDSDIKLWLQVDPSSPSGISWKGKKPNTTAYAGKPALTCKTTKGYWAGTFCRKHLKAHRVVYFLEHGSWPEQVDHINGVRSDNRPENLRSADAFTNQHNVLNVKGAWKEVSSGYTRYRAKIVAYGKCIYLGSFPTMEEAAQAYRDAKAHYHPAV